MTHHTLSIPSFKPEDGFERLELRDADDRQLTFAVFGSQKFLRWAGSQLTAGETTGVLDGRTIRMGGGPEATLLSVSDGTWIGIRVNFVESA